MARKHTLLQLPQGVESLHLEEAFSHRMRVRMLEDLYLSWGYLPVELPVFDFYDAYRPLLSPAMKETIYRLIDRDGDLLMLRSDNTLFLAKQIGIGIDNNKLPARVCYAGSILRHQNSDDIQKNEFFQAGIELIGKTGIEADIEVIALLKKTLTLLGAEDGVIHIGSRGILNSVARTTEKKKVIEDLAEGIRFRDTESITSILPELGIPEPTAALLTELFLFIGSADEFRSFCSDMTEKSKTVSDPFFPAAELEYLISLIGVLEELDLLDGIRIDLSEIGGQTYYTGIVFQAYLDGSDSAVASGGRYDSLLSEFGFPAPSVGFSLLLRKLESVLRDRGEKPGAAPQIEPLAGESFINRYKTGETLRHKGRCVRL